MWGTQAGTTAPAQSALGGAAPASWDLPEGACPRSVLRLGCTCALDLVPPLGKGEWQRPAPSGGHAVGREEGRRHTPLLEATPPASRGTFELGWEENPPPSKEARSQDCGTGREAIRWVPNPWGPR